MPHIPPNVTADASPRSIGGRIIRVAALAVLVFVAAATALHTNRQESQLRADMTKYAAAAATMDGMLRPFAGNANIWLSYQNFDTAPIDMDERWRMLQWYTRATYTFYPHRIYVADDNVAVPVGFSGNPMPPFMPSHAWLAEHSVKFRLILRRQPGTDFTLYSEKL